MNLFLNKFKFAKKQSIQKFIVIANPFYKINNFRISKYTTMNELYRRYKIKPKKINSDKYIKNKINFSKSVEKLRLKKSKISLLNIFKMNTTSLKVVLSNIILVSLIILSIVLYDKISITIQLIKQKLFEKFHKWLTNLLSIEVWNSRKIVNKTVNEIVNLCKKKKIRNDLRNLFIEHVLESENLKKKLINTLYKELYDYLGGKFHSDIDEVLYNQIYKNPYFRHWATETSITYWGNPENPLVMKLTYYLENAIVDTLYKSSNVFSLAIQNISHRISNDKEYREGMINAFLSSGSIKDRLGVTIKKFK